MTNRNFRVLQCEEGNRSANQNDVYCWPYPALDGQTRGMRFSWCAKQGNGVRMIPDKPE